MPRGRAKPLLVLETLERWAGAHRGTRDACRVRPLRHCVRCGQARGDFERLMGMSLGKFSGKSGGDTVESCAVTARLS